jgi:hypothetical protein
MWTQIATERTAAPCSPAIVVVRSAIDFAIPLHQVRISIASPKRGSEPISSVALRMIQAPRRSRPASRASATAISCSHRLSVVRCACPSGSTSAPPTISSRV